MMARSHTLCTLVVLSLLLSITLSAQAEIHSDAMRVTVTRVIDGDTIVVEIGDHEEKVRLIGVDTPETVHPTRGEEPYGKEASYFTKAMLPVGTTVFLETDVEERDRYGRLLAYVYLEDGRMFNSTLVRLGYAQVATFPPNVKYANTFRELQAEARNENIGLWRLDDLCVNPIGDADREKTTTADAGVVIVSVDLDREIVVIKNTGTSPVDMTGWKLVSEKGNQVFHFPDGFVLAAGEGVRVTSGRGAKQDPPMWLKWTGSYIWNNDGDAATLYDAQGKRVPQRP